MEQLWFIFCISWEVRVQFLPTDVVIQLYQHHLLKIFFFHQWMVLGLLLKYLLTIDTWIYIYTCNYIPLIYMWTCNIDLYGTESHRPNCFSFVLSFEIKKCKSSLLFLFFSIDWLSWVNCISIQNLGPVFQFLQKANWDSDKCCIESAPQSREYCHLSHIKYSSTWTWDTLLFRSSISFNNIF